MNPAQSQAFSGLLQKYNGALAVELITKNPSGF